MRLHKALIKLTSLHEKNLYEGIKGAKEIEFKDYKCHNRENFILPHPVCLIDNEEVCIILSKDGQKDIKFIEIFDIKDHPDYYGLFFGTVTHIKYLGISKKEKNMSEWDIKSEVNTIGYEIETGRDSYLTADLRSNLIDIKQSNMENIVTAIHNIHFCT